MKTPSSALALRAFCAALAVLLGACSQTPITVDLHSLQQSGNVSFVCRADDGMSTGHLLNECPDREHGSRHLLGLVTQTATDEVAIVDIYAGAVVDVDPGIPGYTFLRVGARPGAIVTTPGGAASFVGVTGLQKNGVFGLPTTCLSAPEGTQKARDLTTWSACALSSAPGDMRVLVDPAMDGHVRGSCDGSLPDSVNQSGRDCPADLKDEGGPKGRRKLLVSLPEEHKLVLLDAQALLDRNPGEFQPCNVEATFALDGSVPTPPAQVLPDELIPDASVAGTDACVVTPFPPLLTSTLPTPGGFALAEDTLYVADRSLPLVHKLDVSDPCAAREEPPLLPVSYLDKTRVVTTSRVAVSPLLTPTGSQYLYAVDDQDQPAASVMVFDVSPASVNRTPLVFAHAELQPYSPPDRLRFNAPVRDVTFALRDFPKPDPATGVGAFGTTCNPDPGLDPTAPGALYRPNSDFSDGARPFNLRGVFGFAMLTNGQIAVIDVDDFDEPCRRPISMNTSSIPDFRGCFSDKPAPKNSPDPSYFTDTRLITGVPTVSNESSCTAIETNRARSEFPLVSSATNGLHAPTLRAFPQFSNPDPSAVVAAGEQPHLLGVDFASTNPKDTSPVPAQVNISDQLYVNCATPPCDNGAEKLELDPGLSPPNSVVLPLEEPRSYGADDSPVLTFEGRVFPDRTSGFLQPNGASTQSQGLLQDPDANYCAAGVEDADSILSEADSLGISGATLRKNWAAAHADYVQITGDFPVDTDAYWTVGAGTKCSRDACSNEFGTIDNPAALSVSRDMSIVQAYGDHLVVTPRCEKSDGTHDDSCSPFVVLQDLACCFPAGTPYTVRASHQWLLAAAGGLNDLASGPDGRCVHTASCDRRKQHFHQRAFEVCDSDASADPKGTCKASDPTLGCVAGGSDIPVEPGGKASACIFENLTSRFVVYRGSQPSTRGMSFTWQITGGFAPLTMSLATQSTQVNPQSIVYIPEYDQLAVIDGSTLGLSLFDLNSLAVSTPSPFF